MVRRTGRHPSRFQASSRRSLSRAQFLLLLASLLLLPAICTHAQAFHTQDPGPGSVEITGKWQFHTGDNLAWADPAFNDSGWEQLSIDKSWGAAHASSVRLTTQIATA